MKWLIGVLLSLFVVLIAASTTYYFLIKQTSEKRAIKIVKHYFGKSFDQYNITLGKLDYKFKGKLEYFIDDIKVVVADNDLNIQEITIKNARILIPYLAILGGKTIDFYLNEIEIANRSIYRNLLSKSKELRQVDIFYPSLFKINKVNLNLKKLSLIDDEKNKIGIQEVIIRNAKFEGVSSLELIKSFEFNNQQGRFVLVGEFSLKSFFEENFDNLLLYGKFEGFTSQSNILNSIRLKATKLLGRHFVGLQVEVENENTKVGTFKVTLDQNKLNFSEIDLNLETDKFIIVFVGKNPLEISGMKNISGNVFYDLAKRSYRLDISAINSSGQFKAVKNDMSNLLFQKSNEDGQVLVEFNHVEGGVDPFEVSVIKLEVKSDENLDPFNKIIEKAQRIAGQSADLKLLEGSVIDSSGQSLKVVGEIANGFFKSSSISTSQGGRESSIEGFINFSLSDDNLKEIELKFEKRKNLNIVPKEVLPYGMQIKGRSLAGDFKLSNQDGGSHNLNLKGKNIQIMWYDWINVYNEKIKTLGKKFSYLILNGKERILNVKALKDAKKQSFLADIVGRRKIKKKLVIEKLKNESTYRLSVYFNKMNKKLKEKLVSKFQQTYLVFNFQIDEGKLVEIKQDV
jgi:hypothetical protein